VLATSKFKNEFSYLTESVILIAEEKFLSIFDRIGNKLASIAISVPVLDIQTLGGTEEQSFTVLFENNEIATYRIKTFEARTKDASEALIQEKPTEKKIEKAMFEEERRANLKEQAMKAYNETDNVNLDDVKFTNLQIMRLRGKIYISILSSDNYLM